MTLTSQSKTSPEKNFICFKWLAMFTQYTYYHIDVSASVYEYMQKNQNNYVNTHSKNNWDIFLQFIHSLIQWVITVKWCQKKNVYLKIFKRILKFRSTLYKRYISKKNYRDTLTLHVHWNIAMCLLTSRAGIPRCKRNQCPWELMSSGPLFPGKEYPVDSHSWEWLTFQKWMSRTSWPRIK